VEEHYYVDLGTRDPRKPIRFCYERSISSSEIIPLLCRCGSFPYCRIGSCSVLYNWCRRRSSTDRLFIIFSTVHGRSIYVHIGKGFVVFPPNAPPPETPTLPSSPDLSLLKCIKRFKRGNGTQMSGFISNDEHQLWLRYRLLFNIWSCSCFQPSF
jgi:hypothetical protein